MARNEGGKMKLKNKKTGEIVSVGGELMLLKQYSSLAELNEEWEDFFKRIGKIGGRNGEK